MDEAAELALPDSKQTAGDIQVVLVADATAIGETVEGILAASFGIRRLGLDEALGGHEKLPAAVVFCFSRLRVADAKRVAEAAAGQAMRPIFVFSSYKLDWIEAAREIGVDDCFTPPLDGAALVATVRRTLNDAVEAGWSRLHEVEEQALRASVASFNAVMRAGAEGKPLPLDEVNRTCEHIQRALRISRVDRWLDALKLHHNNTYRHSMFVCGVLAFFAQSLGVRGAELREVTAGGFLHDAGKAMIPLAVLDKPARLDADEWKVMRTHPEHSRTILLREHGLSPRIVRMAVHHHEKLDGTGYPDGLAASQLDDLVRLTCIADVYAALAEQRAYKPSLPPTQALEIMAGFRGHLDPDLLRAFRAFILDHLERNKPVAA